jgi:hypothetical protein
MRDFAVVTQAAARTFALVIAELRAELEKIRMSHDLLLVCNNTARTATSCRSTQKKIFVAVSRYTAS